jgi:hypothetical protein
MNQNAMAEATLQDLLHDPVGQIMMSRDGVTVEEILNLMEDMRHRLFEPMAADDCRARGPYAPETRSKPFLQGSRNAG